MFPAPAVELVATVTVVELVALPPAVALVDAAAADVDVVDAAEDDVDEAAEDVDFLVPAPPLDPDPPEFLMRDSGTVRAGTWAKKGRRRRNVEMNEAFMTTKGCKWMANWRFQKRLGKEWVDRRKK